MTSSGATRAHPLRLMSGRDPHESHRASTPLELLYDLTFVVAFGVASDQIAHLLACGGRTSSSRQARSRTRTAAGRSPGGTATC